MPVSDVFSSAELEHAERRRAAWGLTILVLLAVLIVAVMVFVLGTSGGPSKPVGLADGSTPAGASTSAPPSSAQSTATSAAPANSSSTSASTTPTVARPTSTGSPCPSTAPCVVSGDAGQVVQALNAFRTSHGSPAVPGAVSAGAAACALGHGGGPTCQPHFSWEPVGSTQDGAKVVSLIAGRGTGWLLDPQMSSFSVGWVYFPSGSGGHYECAVLKVG